MLTRRCRFGREHDTDPPRFTYQLRLGGKRRGEEATRDHPEEDSSLHHSIT
jgi:hypothetical protein